MKVNPSAAWGKYIFPNWFLNFLMIRIRIKSCSLGIPLFFILFGIAIFFACKHDGSWESGSDYVGLKQDYFMFAIYLVLTFMAFGIITALNRLETFLKSLPDMVVPSARPTVEDKVKWIRESVTAKTTNAKIYLAVLISIMAMLIAYMQFLIPIYEIGEVEKSWSMMPKVFKWSYGVGAVWTVFWLSLLANFLWYSLSMAFATWWALRDYSKKDQLYVIPVAPDGKGGLSSIGDVSYAISISASSGVIGLIVWMILFEADLYFWIGAAGYGATLLTLFFIPLIAVHKAMATARDNEMKRLSNLFMDGYNKLREYGDQKEGVATISDPQMEESAEYLSNLDQLYTRAEAMPVWPFEAILLVRLILVVILPFVAGVLQGALGQPALELLKKMI